MAFDLDATFDLNATASFDGVTSITGTLTENASTVTHGGIIAQSGGTYSATSGTSTTPWLIVNGTYVPNAGTITGDILYNVNTTLTEAVISNGKIIAGAGTLDTGTNYGTTSPDLTLSTSATLTANASTFTLSRNAYMAGGIVGLSALDLDGSEQVEVSGFASPANDS